MDLICRLKESRWFSLFIAIIIINLIVYIILILIPDSAPVKFVTNACSTVAFFVSIYMLFYYKDNECKIQSMAEQKEMLKSILKGME